MVGEPLQWLMKYVLTREVSLPSASWLLSPRKKRQLLGYLNDWF